MICDGDGCGGCANECVSGGRGRKRLVAGVGGRGGCPERRDPDRYLFWMADFRRAGSLHPPPPGNTPTHSKEQSRKGKDREIGRSRVCLRSFPRSDRACMCACVLVRTSAPAWRLRRFRQPEPETQPSTMVFFFCFIVVRTLLIYIRGGEGRQRNSQLASSIDASESLSSPSEFGS